MNENPAWTITHSVIFPLATATSNKRATFPTLGAALRWINRCSPHFGPWELYELNEHTWNLIDQGDTPVRLG